MQYNTLSHLHVHWPEYTRKDRSPSRNHEEESPLSHDLSTTRQELKARIDVCQELQHIHRAQIQVLVLIKDLQNLITKLSALKNVIGDSQLFNILTGTGTNHKYTASSPYGAVPTSSQFTL